MTEKLQHREDNGTIVKAAPHPCGGPLLEKEYYMADPSRDGLRLLATAGETHRVVYWLDMGGGTPRIQYHACETMVEAERLLYEHMFVDFSAEGVIKRMEEVVQKLRDVKVPDAKSFQGMPYAGQQVWVISPQGEPVQVKVTEIGEMNGSMCVIFGFHYKPNGQWFWTEDAARAYLESPDATVRAKNVFLGDKS